MKHMIKFSYKQTIMENLAAFRGSIVVSISACHAEDPGSIPGRGVWSGLDTAAAPSCRQRATVLTAAIAQLGERQTEDLKVPGSIPGLGIFADPGLACTKNN